MSQNMSLWPYPVGLSSSSSVSAAVRRLQTLDPSPFCFSSLWTVVSPGDSSRNSSSATAVIRLAWWPWRSRCVPAQLQLAFAGGSPLRTDTFIAHGSLTRYIQLSILSEGSLWLSFLYQIPSKCIFHFLCLPCINCAIPLLFHRWW